jgi:hypothetical protein
MLKNPSKYERDTLQANFIIVSPVPSASLLDVSACRIYRELWWTNWECSPFDIISPWFETGGCIIGPLVATVQRFGLTPST